MERPRRSARKPARFTESSLPERESSRSKRKVQVRAEEVQPAEELDRLLKHPKSALTSMDLSDLINFGSWQMLSTEAQTALKALLPPTAFVDYIQVLDENHPAIAKTAEITRHTSSEPMEVDGSVDTSTAELDPALFSDAHFLAASQTFQDHIFSNYMSDKHTEKVQQFQDGIILGTLAAQWKDEQWEQNNAGCIEPSNKRASNTTEQKAGGASQIKLGTLAQQNVVRVGDVLAYKRFFTGLDLVVEKDLIIQEIHPKTHNLIVLTAAGTTKELPSDLLVRDPAEPGPTIRSMNITSPTMLESGLLDIDGRVEKSKRPNGNAWKSFTVWRWRGDGSVDHYRARGGRDNHNTLFYLRGCYYHDR